MLHRNPPQMGISDSQGLCGIAMAPSYPIKKGPNPPKPGPEPGPKPGPKPGPTPPKPGPVKCDDVSGTTPGALGVAADA